MGRIVWGVILFASLACLYLLLAGSIDAVEATAASIGAVAGTALAVSLSLVSHQRFAWTVPGRAIVRPLAALAPDAWSVGRTLLTIILRGSRPHEGDFARQSFDPGQDDAASATRRAVVVLGMSLAPRSYVVRGERTDELLLHSLPRKAPSADIHWPA